MDNRFQTEIHLSLVLGLGKSFSRTELRHGCAHLFKLQDSFQDCDDFLLCNEIVLVGD